ncbi:VanZ family protein [Cardiobacteriaceae bacterium TAE3-ERU3]|nr:VanZ family protein [Cardiobacteriaceae bacterium TAE3-ERU3]
MHKVFCAKIAESLRSSQAFLVIYTVPIVHGWLVLVLILCVLPTPVSVQPNIAHIDKLVHGFMYALPACLLSVAARINWKWIAYLVAFGIAVELIQSCLSYRSGDIYDGCANTLGVLLGWWLGRVMRNKLRNGR